MSASAVCVWVSTLALSIVPTKEIETPFGCLKTLTIASSTHSSQWSHGVFSIKCDYTSSKAKDDLYAELKKGFSKYLTLPERTKSGTAGWRIRVDGIDYRFRFQTTVDSVKSQVSGVTKIEIQERPHLSLEMSVPIDGSEPKRWWKKAIVDNPALTEFGLDRAIRATGGNTQGLQIGQFSFAYLDCTMNEALLRLQDVLQFNGYKQLRFKQKGLTFYNPAREMYRVVFVELKQGGRTLTKLTWYTSKNKSKRRVSIPECGYYLAQVKLR